MEVLIYRAPNGIELKPLTKFSDLQKAYEAWPVGASASVRLMERVAKYNPCIGAFLDDRTLVSWVFR